MNITVNEKIIPRFLRTGRQYNIFNVLNRILAEIIENVSRSRHCLLFCPIVHRCYDVTSEGGAYASSMDGVLCRFQYSRVNVDLRLCLNLHPQN